MKGLNMLVLLRGAVTHAIRRMCRSRREIFRFWDGSKWRWADPIALNRELDKAGGEHWAAHLDVLSISFRIDELKLDPNMQRNQATALDESTQDLVRIIRTAFALPAFDPRSGLGLTEAECIDLLAGYLHWMAQAESDARPLPSSPPPTGPCPANSTTIID
jgi:hypothetical protein